VLNVLAAVLAARQGADRAALVEVLAERDAAAVAKEVRSWTRADGKAVRERFLSFGCCGVEEPLAELRELGVLEDEETW
jgi:hypothetical protein